jgi:hypothetical protein
MRKRALPILLGAIAVVALNPEHCSSRAPALTAAETSDTYGNLENRPRPRNPHPKWCPIFILFSREGGVFRPHFPAIEAMVANLERVVGAGAVK